MTCLTLTNRAVLRLAGTLLVMGVIASGNSVAMAAGASRPASHPTTASAVAPAASAQAPASGMAVATGTLTSASGAAMAGETVDLYAWPSDTVLTTMKDGQHVPTTLLATAATSSSGRYMLRVPAATLKKAAVSSGYANLEISSPAGGSSFFSYQTSSLPAHPPAPVTVDLTPDLGVNCGHDALDRPYAFSGFSKLKQRNPAWAIVGQGYINPVRKTRGDTIQFNYNQSSTKSQTSTLGLGISGYGINAGYNTSGTTTSTADQTVNYPSQRKSTWFRTEFNTALFRGECYGLPGDVKHVKQHGYCPRHYYPVPGLVRDVRKCFWMVRSTGWFGISGDWVHPKRVPSTPAKYCAQEEAGLSGQTNRQKAIQWSTGFTIGAADKITKSLMGNVSFSSSTQTGYDTNDQMIFIFKKTGWLCGTNHDVATAALLVVRSSRA
jgi:hypothetical protein